MSLRSVPVFEKRFQNRIRIHVFYHDKEEGIIPLHTSSYKEGKTVHLLMMKLDENEEKKDTRVFKVKVTHHFVLILDLNKFMFVSKRVSNKRVLKYAHVCPRCLLSLSTSQALANHEKHCQDTQAVEMPKPGSVLEFKNWHFTVRKPIQG